MADDGTGFDIELGVQGGSDAKSAAESLAELANRLELAGVAAIRQSEAVKAGETAYRQAESAADRAAKALEKIGIAAAAQEGKVAKALEAGDLASATKAQAKLETLIARQGEAASKAASTSAAMNAAASSLDTLKGAAAAAADNEARLAKSLDEAKTAATAAGKAQATAAANAAKAQKTAADSTAKVQAQAAGSGKVNEIAEGFGKLGGPLGSLGQKAFGAAEGVKKLSGSLGSAGPYVAVAIGIAAIVAGVVAVGAAAVIATFHVTAWAVSLADAARTQGLLAAGIAKSIAGGAALDATIEELQLRVPQTRDELLAMASTLAATGLSGGKLTDALEAAALKAAKLKFGPDFERQMLSLEQQSKRLKAGIAGIFGGLKIEGLLTELSAATGLFDKSTASGKAIKVVFESLFQPLIDGVTAWVPKMVAAFIQFEILVLKALIAIKPFGSKILMVAQVLGIVAAVLAGALAIAIGVVIAGVTAMAVGFAFGLTAVLAIGAAAIWLGAKFAGLGSAIFEGLKAAWDWLSSLSLTGIGTALIDGLIAGIKSAAGGILTAMTGAVGAAIDGAKSLLGIASPSKVFAEIGQNTAAGMAIGVDDGAADVKTALETVVSPPAAPPAGAPAAAKSAGAKGGGSGANVTGNTFQFFGVEGMEDAEARFGAVLTRLLEGDVASLGSAAPDAP